METNVTLLNNSEFYLNNEELFLRSIPTKLKVGPLTTDSLRLLVYYVTKASPYELAVETGYFTGTLQEWLDSLQATLTFKDTVATYADLVTITNLNQGDLVFVEANGKVYPFDGEGFPPEDKGLEITGASAYQLAKKAGFVGTEAEWLDSLKLKFEDLSPTEIAALKGAKGDQGDEGLKGDTGDVGPAGKSAYDSYVETVDGEPLSEANWIASLKGAKGDTGDRGADGDVGEAGPQGKSAYQVALDNEFSGTEQEWLDSLHANVDDQLKAVKLDGKNLLLNSGTALTRAPNSYLIGTYKLSEKLVVDKQYTITAKITHTRGAGDTTSLVKAWISASQELGLVVTPGQTETIVSFTFTRGDFGAGTEINFYYGAQEVAEGDADGVAIIHWATVLEGNINPQDTPVAPVSNQFDTVYNNTLPPTYSTGNSSPVAIEDPLVVIVGKLQAQISDLEIRLASLENPPAA